MTTNYQRFLPDASTFRKPTLVFFVFSICFAFWFNDFWRPYNVQLNQNNFVWDVFGYYSYLPATFCNNGSFEWADQPSDHNPVGPLKTHLPKYTYGMALMYSPFFALGYKVAINQKSPLNGFSEPFATCIRWGSIFYVFLGLLFLRKLLLFYFNEPVVALTLLGCLFGSVLFTYAFIQSEMTHGYLFTLFSAFLYYTHQWHRAQKFRYTLALAFVLGLISVIRPTEVFIFFFFVFWNVKSRADLKIKFTFLLKNYLHLAVMLLMAILLWIPQLLFYKHYAGSYFYFSYSGEGFFWKDPQILNILLSYRKGWITYTPLVVLAFAGFFFVRKRFPVAGLTFFLVTALTVYVLSCWWDWGYGGCFGAREFCQHMAYLAIPMASIISYASDTVQRSVLRGFLGLVTMAFVFSCVCLNLGQSYLYQKVGFIHFDGMTKEIYWEIFNKYQFKRDFPEFYQKNLREPNFEKMRNGDRD